MLLYILVGFVIFCVAFLIFTKWYTKWADKKAAAKTKDIVVSEFNNSPSNKDYIKRLNERYDSYVKEYNEKVSSFEYYADKAAIVSEGEKTLKAVITTKQELFIYEFSMPKPAKIVTNRKFSTGEYYVERVNEPKPGYFDTVMKEKLENISYYIEEGNLQYTTAVGGGGVDVAGAIKGGLIAGTAGAIVGGRQAVYSQTVEHDNRKLFLVKKTGERIEFDYKEYFPAFSKIMPEKDYNFIRVNK